MLKISKFIVLVAILSSVIFVSGCQKDKTGEDFAITLRLSHVFNVNEELAQSIELVADRINKKTKGAVRVLTYP